MSRYLNTTGIPLSLAVFLATDNYEHSAEPFTISVTTLLKPLRQIILSARIPVEDVSVDIASMVQNRMGNAIHDAIEQAWLKTRSDPTSLKMLGYPAGVLSKILINPQPAELFDGCIPIYLEQRVNKKVGKWTVTGKYDFVGDGRLEDFKSTSTYVAMNNTNDLKYSQQGSMYRWLNPDIITHDEIAIQWIFTDWSKARAMSEPKYPQNRTQQKLFGLMSVQETQAFVERKLALIEQYWDAGEADIPACTDEDLWRSEPVFKYYKNPESTKRSTKNFDNQHDANLRLIEDGSIGIVKEVPGQVTACKYCAAFSVCTQKDSFIASGDLVI